MSTDTSERNDEIRRRAGAGAPYSLLAREYGISGQRVAQIVRGKQTASEDADKCVLHLRDVAKMVLDGVCPISDLAFPLRALDRVWPMPDKPGEFDGEAP